MLLAQNGLCQQLAHAQPLVRVELVDGLRHKTRPHAVAVVVSSLCAEPPSLGQKALDRILQQRGAWARVSGPLAATGA